MPVDRDRRRRARTRAASLLIAWLATWIGLVLVPLPAQAAAGGLVASSPEDREELGDAPGSVTLAFEGEVDDSVAKVLVLDASGANVTDGPLIVEATNVTTQLRDDLPQGTYTVHYRVNGSAGEPRGGALQFSYGAGTFTDLPDRTWSGSAQEPEVLRGDDPNGPEEPAGTDTPGIEVTASEKNDRQTDPPPATTGQPDDPTDEPTDDPAETTEAADPGTDDPASDDPSRSSTATAVEDDDNSSTFFLVGGVLLLAAVAGGAIGLYRSRRGRHD